MCVCVCVCLCVYGAWSLHLNRHFLKFADDTVIASLLHKDAPEHGPVGDERVKWCDEAFLQLNATKTEDHATGFRRNASHPPSQNFIKGTGIEFVNLKI